MTDRVHRCLDGEVPRSVLTELELEELEKLEAAVERSLDVVREEPAPDVSAVVMARIREGESAPSATDGHGNGVGVASWVRGLATWIWEPRPVRLRPAWALVAVAAVAVGMALLPGGTERGGEEGGAVAMDQARTPADAVEGSEAAAERAPTIYVRFELDAEGASSVRLAGSFSGWEPRIELAERTPGHWTATVALEPGVHDYAFVVDGDRWVTDPGAIPVRDGFGGTNSRIAVLAPEPSVNGASS